MMRKLFIIVSSLFVGISGRWLTTKVCNSLEEARDELALLEQFKPIEANNPLVLREYTIKKAFNTRRGIVGELSEANGKIRKGGTTQIEFGEKYNPYGNTSNWEDYLENTSTDGVRGYLKLLN
jgi:hypothetical protein